MDILSKIIKVFFGSKADKDRKEILPYVEKIKALYPTISALTNDELRERSAALSRKISEAIAKDESHIAEQKAILEQPEISLADKERISKDIDDTTKRLEVHKR